MCAYHPASGKTVIFGGFDGVSGSAINDLYTWDGTNFTKETPVGGPPSARTGSGFCNWTPTNSLILFGGQDNTFTNLADTWELTFSAGTWTWTQLTTTGTPSARVSQMMEYHPASTLIVMYG